MTDRLSAMAKSINLSQLLPVLFGFFIMGFCDVVGISTSYVQRDFHLSETMAGFIPSMVFIWFLLVSLPGAMLMNRIGRKNMVQLSNMITIGGMIIPFFTYNFASCMIAFLLLGIGNTLLQVSLNPLLSNVVRGNALASSLTAGQVMKAISSFCGPLIAAFAALYLGNWKYLFPIFAAITVVAALWLQITPIAKEPAESNSSLGGSLGLLKRPHIRLLFLGIFFVVGADVGTNTVAPKLLIEHCGYSIQDAGFASSLYFVCRTAGAFAGTLFLTVVPEIRYFRINILAAIVAVALLFFMTGYGTIMTMIGLTGFFCSSIFSIIYSEALKSMPDKENEISGLMIMGLFGGAVIPPLMGVMADATGNQTGSLTVITACLVYLCYCSMKLKSQKGIHEKDEKI